MSERVSVTELFSREEIKMLTAGSDAHGAWAVASTWAVIGATLDGVGMLWQYLPWWGKLVFCILSLIIRAGRPLALGMTCHDASHYICF